MTAITIRKLPDAAKQRLRMRAAANGRSMEAEARSLLLQGLQSPVRADLNWIEQLAQIGDQLGGVELELPADEPAPAADFSEQ